MTAPVEDVPARSTMKCELLVRHSFFNSKGDKVTEIKDESTLQDLTNETHALSLIRNFNKDKQLEESILSINSKHILAILRAVIKQHPALAGDFTSPIAITSPFQPLVHFWEDLHSYVDDLTDATARMHGRLLLHFMDTEVGKDKAAFDAQVRSGQIDWSYLWILYKPGDLVVTKEKDSPWLQKVVQSAYEESITAGKYLSLTCTYTYHNGTRVGTATEITHIMQKENFPQQGPSVIKTLPAVPRRVYEAGEDLELHLQERGKKFLEISAGSPVCDYDGVAQYLAAPPPNWWHPDQGEDPKVWKTFTEVGKIIIDPKTYGEDHVDTSLKEFDFDGSPEMLARCPPFVYGYSASRKDWCRFFLTNVKAATWKESPFDELALPEDQKHLVKALVTSHQYPAPHTEQILQKGKGLVCLLHGPPGSGKTLTAECVSHMTKRALISCTMSELNRHNYHRYFERELAKVLRLATTWRAIVLLDEADVFLETRKDGGYAETERNALVAVFLKHLEYFSGIIFLTTNRINVFDPAMKSRVHLALGYQAPGVEARRKIWTQQFELLTKDDIDVDMVKVLDRVQDCNLNGREIAYTVLTARTLGRYDNEPLRLKHIEMVLKVRKDFDDALQ